jgi:uncharacterized protein YjiS (DUF1127 family)
MTVYCLQPAAAPRRLDDYAFSLRANPMLRRAHAAIDGLDVWIARRRRRKTLAEIAAMGEHAMLDLGFDPDETRAEAVKPFWRR